MTAFLVWAFLLFYFFLGLVLLATPGSCFVSLSCRFLHYQYHVIIFFLFLIVNLIRGLFGKLDSSLFPDVVQKPSVSLHTLTLTPRHI